MQIDLKTGVSIVSMIVAGVSAVYAFMTTTQEGIRDLEARIIALESTDPVPGPKGDPGEQGERGPAGPQGLPGEAGTSAGLPKGIVVASTVECADLGSDWRAYREAEGRMIVGVGGTSDDRGETRVIRKGESGGAFQHQLTEPQMPGHVHGVRRQTDIGARDDNAFLARGEAGNMSDASTSSRGGGRPHNNMPPYIALYFCKKEA